MPGATRRSTNRRSVLFPLVASILAGLLPAATGRAQNLADSGPLVVVGDPIRSVATANGGGRLYAAGSAALYRSDDGGDSWVEVGPPPPALPVVVGDGEPDVLLAGDPPWCAFGAPPFPLYRSADGGASWSVVDGADGVRPVAVWPGSGAALAVACTALLVSQDAGLTWTDAWRHSVGDITTVATVARPWIDDGVVPEGFVVVTSEGGGSSLLPIDLADPTAPRVFQPVRGFWGLGAVLFDGERLVLGEARGVWVSDDAGATWRGGRAGLEEVTLSVNPTFDPIPEVEMGRRNGVDALAVHPTDRDRLFAGTPGGLFVSTDGAATWRAVPGVTAGVLALAVAATSNRLFVETETGVVVLPI